MLGDMGWPLVRERLPTADGTAWRQLELIS
jgi:hypothetical protein